MGREQLPFAVCVRCSRAFEILVNKAIYDLSIAGASLQETHLSDGRVCESDSHMHTTDLGLGGSVETK